MIVFNHVNENCYGNSPGFIKLHRVMFAHSVLRPGEVSDVQPNLLSLRPVQDVLLEVVG